MKQEASPAIIAVVVVLALLLIGMLGWKFLGPGSKGDTNKDPYGSGGKEKYMPHSGGMGGANTAGFGSGGPGSGGFGSGGR